MATNISNSGGTTWVVNEGSTIPKDNYTYSTSSTNTVRVTDLNISHSQSNSGNDCNESKVHDHAQKAVFHGMKSAFRYISKGRKGVDNRQPDNAARIAGEVGSAYLNEKDIDYDRERSLEDIEDQHMKDDGVIGKLIDLFKNDVLPDGGRGPLSEDELEEAIERAWNKIDAANHKAGARVAVAACEAYLGEEIHHA